MSNLKNTLTNNFILISALPIIIFGVISIYILGERMEKDVSTKDLLLVKSLSSEVERFLAEPLAVISLIRDMVNSMEIVEEKTVNTYLNMVINNHKAFDTITMMDAEGIVTHMAPHDEDYIGNDVSQQEYFNSLDFTKGLHWSSTFISVQTGKATVTISARCYNDMVIAGHLKLSILEPLMNRILVLKGGYTAITDRNGLLIAHSNNDLVNQQLSLKHLVPVKMALSGKTGRYYYLEENRKMICTVDIVPHTRWVIGIYRTHEAAFAHIAHIRHLIIYGALISTIIAVLIALSILKKTLRPLSQLVDRTRRITGGDYEVSFEKTGYDELNELVGGFEVMAGSIKQRETQLRESESKFRAIFEQAAIGIGVMSPEGRWIQVNQLICDITGYSHDEISGRLFTDITHPDDIKKDISSLQSLIEGKIDVSYIEKRYIRKDGATLRGLRVMSMIKNAEKKPLYFVVILKDITKRKEAEEKLKQLTTIIEATTDIVYSASPDSHQITYMNSAAADMLGWNDSDGKKPKTIFDAHPVWASKILTEQGIPEAVSKGVWKGETAIVSKDGIEIAVSQVIMSHRDNMENLSYLSTIIRDITDRKRIEAEKLRLEETLAQSQKMEAIGTLAGGISHDFNNILSGIIGYAELVQLNLEPENPAHRHLESLLKAGDRARELVHQILAFSHQTRTEKKSCDMTKIVKDALEFLKLSTPANIKIRKNIRSGLGTVFADQTRIHQILINICANAFHAMEPDGGSLDISLDQISINRIETEAGLDLDPGNYLQLMVADTGCGLSPEVLSRIFDPYYTTKQIGKGTGLGLATVQSIVKDHGGTIKAYSEKDNGTVFNVFFPVMQEKPPKQRLVIERPLQTGSETILFVDDEPDLVEISTHMLTKLGYKVESRNSPIDALNVFISDPSQYNLLITDMTMPEMTGEKLIEKVREVRPDLPVILCTGYSKTMTDERVKEAGINEFLQKPLNIGQLSRAIRRVISLI